MVLTRLLLYTSNNGKLCGIIAFAHNVMCGGSWWPRWCYAEWLLLFQCYQLNCSIGIVDETVVQNPCLSCVAYLQYTMALYHKRKIVLTISSLSLTISPLFTHSSSRALFIMGVNGKYVFRLILIPLFVMYAINWSNFSGIPYKKRK